MGYVEVSFIIDPPVTGREVLAARLAETGYESFMETEKGLKAYIPTPDFKPEALDIIHSQLSPYFKITFSSQAIQDKNWNEEWERNYTPVKIKDKVRIRAPFHKADKNVEYDIIIEPKMSFGTAHHETTAMMIELMLKETFSGRNVLDIGCGTGVLAILAEILKADNILAVDIDEWAYNNTRENILKNNCKKINVQLGDVAILENKTFDVVLANINRNVLLNDMKLYEEHLSHKGVILFSGFYSEDLLNIMSAAKKINMELTDQIQKNNWIAARFSKL